MTHASPDPLEEVTGEALVLFHFQDVPVPRHTLGKVDWYLSGAVSRVAVDGKFTGALGSTALFHPQGKFRVEKIVILGLGPRGEVDAQTLQAVAKHLRRLLQDLRVRDARIVLPDWPCMPMEEAIALFSATLQAPEEPSVDPPRITFLANTDNTHTP
jgi:hypothetical protein